MRTAALFLLLTELDQGQRAFRAKDWPAAERAFGSAIRARPADFAGHKWLGMTLAAQERFLDAEPPLGRACKLAPRDPDACYYHGRTLFTLSRFKEALAVLAAATPQSGRVLLVQALAHEALDHAPDAERLYQAAIAAGDRQAPIDYARFRARQAPPGDAVTPVSFDIRDLPFTVRNGATGRKRLIETMLAGLALFDFNNDGRTDIFLSGGDSPNALLRNNGDGTVTDAATAAGVAGPRWTMGAAAADYDNDGDTDLFLTGVAHHVLYRNRGDGTFEPAPFPTSALWSVSAAWLDYDNDGRLDLFETRYVAWNEAAEPYCGAAGHRVYCHPRQYKGLASALYRNRGDGTFEDVSASTGIARHTGKGMGVTVGDYDRDGRLDIFVANDTEPNFLFRNTGHGFEEIALRAEAAFNADGVAISSMGAEFADWNNDGAEDLFVTALTNETFPLFENTTKGGFRDITMRSGVAKASLPWTGWSNAVADFNNDGWKDFATANGHVMDNAEVTSGRQSRQPNQIYLNRRQSFAAQTIGDPALHRGLASADLDGDGRVDLVVTRLNQPAQIYWNRTARAGRHLALTLRGRASNRDAIGAGIETETGSAKQWSRVTTTAGYGASKPATVHIGLGAETQARLTIHWPSGVVQKFVSVTAGHHTFTEPDPERR